MGPSEKRKVESCGHDACTCGESENVNMGKEANAGFARDDSSTATRLIEKQWSPLTVRKVQMRGWPIFVCLITDANLNDLDELIHTIDKEAADHGFVDGKIQSARNYVGYMTDRIVDHYNSIKTGVVEGVLICSYLDKLWLSSAYGDLMQHEKCVNEVYHIINTLPHI